MDLCLNCEMKPGDINLPVPGGYRKDPPGTQHYACSVACQKHAISVHQGGMDRRALADAKLACPCCKATLSFFCGGPGFYWVECSCGSYSDPAKDIEGLKAICADPAKWHGADPNVSMYPPVGG